MPDGGVITLRTEDGPAGEVSLSISDSGRGIPAEVLPRIFEPFYTTKPAGLGTGLGLAMVRTFVEEAGGRVSASNVPGSGACFTLTFPEWVAPKTASASPFRPPTQHRRILLVEAEPGLRSLLHRVVQGDGHPVTAVASAAEALQRLGTGEKYVLLCADLPFDGPQTLALIDAFQRNQPAAPVLLCAGRADAMLASDRLLRAGVDVLSKPFTASEFLARVQQKLADGAV